MLEAHFEQYPALISPNVYNASTLCILNTPSTYYISHDSYYHSMLQYILNDFSTFFN